MIDEIIEYGTVDRLKELTGNKMTVQISLDKEKKDYTIILDIREKDVEVKGNWEPDLNLFDLIIVENVLHDIISEYVSETIKSVIIGGDKDD